MVAINPNSIDESTLEMRDEGWWESVLSDEQHFSLASSAKENHRQTHERHHQDQ